MMIVPKITYNPYQSDFFEKGERSCEERWEVLKKFIAPGTSIEFGSAEGFFTYKMLSNGISTVSVEASEKRVNFQKDLFSIRRHTGIVFQDPASSLNPRLPIGESIGEPIFLAGLAKGDDLARKVEDLLDQVELPRSYRNRYPHELSGGQRQRVGIARALALTPDLLIADEPTSALDVSVQARFLELLQELQEKLKFACLFISHDLAVVDILAHRIAVMEDGRLVEIGDRDQILQHPKNPYTQRLLAAVPVPDPAEQRLRREARLAAKS